MVKFYLNICRDNKDILLNKKKNDRRIILEKLSLKECNDLGAFYNVYEKFPGVPTYIRRAAINDAISMFSKWEEEKIEGINCALKMRRNVFPSLYKDRIFKRTDGNKALIKLYVGGTWKWLEINLDKHDLKYIAKLDNIVKSHPPILKNVKNKWYLSFSFERNTELHNTDFEDRIVCAVDLGIKNDAVCSILNSKGKILARKFINFKREKSEIEHLVNEKRRAVKKSSKQCLVYSKKINTLNNYLHIKIAKAIVDFCKENNVDVVVLEKLSFDFRKKSPKYLRYWRAIKIQKRIEFLAHKSGIGYSYINPINTSKLAFDGSGEVKRGYYKQNGKTIHNVSICVFPSGKIYNCDLNASYNIGARYFIREIIKSNLVIDWLPEKTKDFIRGNRTMVTLSTLLDINANKVDN